MMSTARHLAWLVLHHVTYFAAVAADDADGNSGCLQTQLLYGTTNFIPTYERICCLVRHGSDEEHPGFHEREGVELFTRLEGMQLAMDQGDVEKAASLSGAVLTDSSFQVGTHIQLNPATGAYEFVFYDSQCGVPLFIAPRGRSFEDFKQDSFEHGWPSFRPEEIVTENNELLSDDWLVSKCPNGARTYIGHRNAGGRYCIDLMCIAGYADPGLNMTAAMIVTGEDGLSDSTSGATSVAGTSVLVALASAMITSILGWR